MIGVLLSMLEAPQPILSAAALHSFPPRIGVELMAQGFIKPAGYEAAATSIADHSDSPVTLTWSPGEQAFGYFCPAEGWITVPNADIVRYRVDLAVVISALTAKMNISRQKEPSEWVADHLWEVGKVRFEGRAHLTDIAFGRRLHNVTSWQAIKRFLEARPSEQRRVILTSTDPDRLPEAPAGNLLISVCNIIGTCEGLAIDPQIISARFDRVRMADSNEAIVLIGDAREVRFFGETFRFPRGVRQRQIIGFIHDRYRRGQRWTSTDEIVAALDLRANARIRDYFKKSPAWNRLLTERKGMCGFCFEPMQKSK
jgi:hypothetical protein